MAGVDVVGLKDFRRELKAIDVNLPKELTRVHQQIARRADALSEAKARSMGGVQRKAASTIKGRGDQRSAKITISGMRGLGNVAFWGAKKHTGWYAAPQYRGSPAQHPRWVGSSWDVAVRGEGPYAINDALAENLDDILDQYWNMLGILTAKAFPER